MIYALNGKYPIETKSQLEKTANYFDRYLSKFHPKDRVVAATSMQKRASYLKVDLGRDWITNYSRALCGNTVSPDFERNMELRKTACHNKTIEVEGRTIKAAELADKIKDDLEKVGAYNTVDSLFAFDKMAGLEYSWDKIVVDPIMTVFGSLRNPGFDSVPQIDPNRVVL